MARLESSNPCLLQAPGRCMTDFFLPERCLEHTHDAIGYLSSTAASSIETKASWKPAFARSS